MNRVDKVYSALDALDAIFSDRSSALKKASVRKVVFAHLETLAVVSTFSPGIKIVLTDLNSKIGGFFEKGMRSDAETVSLICYDLELLRDLLSRKQQG